MLVAKPRLYSKNNTVFCIWCDMKGIVYHGLLNCKESQIWSFVVNWKQQTIFFLFWKKKLHWSLGKILLYFYMTRPHIAKYMQEKILALNMKVYLTLISPLVSDLVPSDYHALRSLQHFLVGISYTNYEEVKKYIDFFSFWLRNLKNSMPNVLITYLLNGFISSKMKETTSI